VLVLTLVLTLFPIGVQVIVNNQNYYSFANELSPGAFSMVSLVLLDVFYLILSLMSVVSLMMTACTDPGIIPRQKDHMEEKL